jgi:hypothetical protein
MLGLVAPVTMSADQQTLWLASAMDALRDIRLDEVEKVSMEVRRTVTRPSQIVPEISRLVSELRVKRSRHSELMALPGPPLRIPVMNRRGQPMSDEDTAELNGILEKLGATARYHADGSRYVVKT